MKFVPKELEKNNDVSRGDHSRITFLKNVSLLIAFFCLLYVLLGFAADLVAYKIPDSWEASCFPKFGHSAEKQEGKAFLRTKAIFEKLTAHSGLRKLPYYCFRIDMDTPNAFAVPGGGVGVTQGLLNNVESEIGLAMVLAHELGHHQNRDCLRRMGRGVLLRLAQSFFVPDEASSVVDTSLLLAESGYSRKQEKEADLFGLRMVHDVYGHTDGALEFFEMIHREYEKNRTKWMSFIASHPWTEDRIAYLRKFQYELEN